MDPQDAIDLSREAIRTCIFVGGPILAVSLLIGLVVSLVQSVTQLQDQSIAFVPKILMLLVAIAAGLPWLSDQMIEFTKYSFEKPVVFQSVSNQTDANLADPNESEFTFQWSSGADSVTVPASAIKATLPTGNSMPTFRSAPSTSQPQFRPQLKLIPQPLGEPQTPAEPRIASPFMLPAFRTADSEDRGKSVDAPAAQTKTF